jgi:hypothetical protein
MNKYLVLISATALALVSATAAAGQETSNDCRAAPRAKALLCW